MIFTDQWCVLSLKKPTQLFIAVFTRDNIYFEVLNTPSTLEDAEFLELNDLLDCRLWLHILNRSNGLLLKLSLCFFDSTFNRPEILHRLVVNFLNLNTWIHFKLKLAKEF
jgi:hypothetical protein